MSVIRIYAAESVEQEVLDQLILSHLKAGATFDEAFSPTSNRAQGSSTGACRKGHRPDCPFADRVPCPRMTDRINV